MKRSNRLMLVLGVLLALVAFGGVLLFGAGSGGAQPASPPTVAVVVAAVDIPLGSTVEAAQLTTIQMDPDAAVDTYPDPSLVIGQTVRQDVRQGEALVASDFQAANAGGAPPDVGGSLKPGYLAMAITLGASTGVTSLIQVGDFVDVMLTVTDEDIKAPVVSDTGCEDGGINGACKIDDDWLNNTTVKVLVQNTQVLAMVSPMVLAAGTSADSTDGTPVSTDTTVILSVTPQQAEMVRFAELDGHLSLLLRSPGDASAADVTTTGITLRELVDKHGVLPPRVVVSDIP